MKVDYIFQRSMFSSKKSARAKILTTWKTTLKFTAPIKVNKSVYIANSRQRYYKTLRTIFLHVPNHALKVV